MGIRLALGADPRALVWLVVRRGVMLTVAGAVCGLGLALGAGDAVASLLYEVSPGDPAMLGGAMLAVVTVSILACYAPARRILKQSPARTLRDV
jgi:putative ABC transport system permease protein